MVNHNVELRVLGVIPVKRPILRIYTRANPVTRRT